MGRAVNRLCTVCGRGGSKGVANKNLRLVRGEPLIAHTLHQALATGLFDVIAVSSDSRAILDAAGRAGATRLIERPAELASDTASKIAAIHHAVTTAEALEARRFDVLVDLDATSPLRLPADIAAAVGLLEARPGSNVITAAPARRSPYFNMVEVDDEGHVRLVKPLANLVYRRQDTPRCFDMNASIYVWRRDAFVTDPKLFYPDTMLHVMPAERSLDIDSELDFAIVKFLMERQSDV